MLCRATVAFCLLLAFETVAFAQLPPSDNGSSSAADSSTSMEQPMVGDHWTYEVHDEITGILKNTNTMTVTDVTPTEVAVRAQTLGNANFAEFVYDHLWNLIDSPLWKYSPNDGSGIKMPLTIGSGWKFQNSAINTQHGVSFKRTGSSKIVGQESITTTAGTFDTFKVESTVEGRNVNDPTKKIISQTTLWYAPTANHVVKQSTKILSNGHVDQQYSIEMVDYGRR